jgi:hypothetical protein
MVLGLRVDAALQKPTHALSVAVPNRRNQQRVSVLCINGRIGNHGHEILPETMNLMLSAANQMQNTRDSKSTQGSEKLE